MYEDVKAAADTLIKVGELYKQFPLNDNYSDDLLLVARFAIEAAERLDAIQQCAEARSDETGGPCTTYEDAFAKLQILTGTLRFIDTHADLSIPRPGEGTR